MRRIYPERTCLWQTLAAVTILALTTGRPVAAQTDAPSPPRTASLTYELQDYRGGGPAWSDWTTITLAASMPVSRVNTTASVFRTERFGQADVGGGVDLYAVTWPGAYVNTRLIVAPGASAVARADASAELYQVVGGDWELSAGYRRLQFPEHGVDVATVSAARYFGGWYTQARTTMVPDGEQVAIAVSGVLRRQRIAERFVEVRAGGGEELVTIARGPVTTLRQMGFAVVRAQDRTLFSPSLGATALAGWQRFEGIPDRMDLSVGVIVTF